MLEWLEVRFIVACTESLINQRGIEAL